VATVCRHGDNFFGRINQERRSSGLLPFDQRIPEGSLLR
jgi:hypothetical protein